MLKPCIALWLISLGIATAQIPAAASAPSAHPSWDRAAAARFLDDRMDLRFARAKQLRTDAGKTACLSCHEVVSYTLARPALRRAMGMKELTAQERRVRDEAIRRVATYATHQLLYENKAKGSRGTEAVLNALILAQQDALEAQPQPSPACRQAFQRMWEIQRPDGAWDWLNFELEPYESTDSVYYGAALAAIAVGTAPGATGNSPADTEDHVNRLRRFLQDRASDQSLYDRAWLLLASTRLAHLLTPAQSAALMDLLQQQQNPDGGWSLYQLGPWRWSKETPPYGPPGKLAADLMQQSDGYATGLIVYALRQAGLPASDPALQRAKSWLETHQRDCRINQDQWKCWRAYSLNFDREQGGDHGDLWPRLFMSDEATAFAVLALLSFEAY